MDACLTGLGGVFKKIVFALPIPTNYQNFNINHIKMIHVMVALKLWGHSWENNKIKINCDNLAVVEVLNHR